MSHPRANSPTPAGFEKKQRAPKEQHTFGLGIGRESTDPMTSQQSSCLNMWINHICKDGKLDLASVIRLLKEDGFNTTESPTRYRFDA